MKRIVGNKSNKKKLSENSKPNLHKKKTDILQAKARVQDTLRARHRKKRIPSNHPSLTIPRAGGHGLAGAR